MSINSARVIAIVKFVICYNYYIYYIIDMCISQGYNVKSIFHKIYPMKMKSILGAALPPPTIPWLYQIFCEKSTHNIGNSKGSSIGNSNIRIHSNSNRAYAPISLFHPAPRKNNL